MRQDLPWSIWQLPQCTGGLTDCGQSEGSVPTANPVCCKTRKHSFSCQPGFVVSDIGWSRRACLNTEAQSSRLSKRESATARSWLGLLRRLVFRSEDEARRLTVPPRPTAFPLAESVAVRAGPCSRKDASSIANQIARKPISLMIDTFRAQKAVTNNIPVSCMSHLVFVLNHGRRLPYPWLDNWANFRLSSSSRTLITSRMVVSVQYLRADASLSISALILVISSNGMTARCHTK